jgi:hypothetical protein
MSRIQQSGEAGKEPGELPLLPLLPLEAPGGYEGGGTGCLPSPPSIALLPPLDDELGGDCHGLDASYGKGSLPSVPGVDWLGGDVLGGDTPIGSVPSQRTSFGGSLAWPGPSSPFGVLPVTLIGSGVSSVSVHAASVPLRLSAKSEVSASVMSN